MTTKIEKQRNIEGAIKNDDGLWDKKAPYHWVRSLKGKQLDYWPTTNHFKYQGKSYHDLNVYDFINSISDKNTMIDGAILINTLTKLNSNTEKRFQEIMPTLNRITLMAMIESNNHTIIEIKRMIDTANQQKPPK